MFQFSSVEHYHAQLKEGQITCLQVVQHYLDQIKATVRLNAFIDVYEEEALTRAKQLDQVRSGGQPLSPLHGVVIAIKDVIAFKGHQLTASSRILQGFHSVYSATAIERLLEAGAIIIGSCNCDEFAMGSTNENSYYGRVSNAIDESLVPGGSSGGSAVAVQANLCMLALGSDTGGSVRQPADLCGIIGFKPGYGRISRYGLIAYGSSFDQIGIFGHTVPDIAVALEVMAGADHYDSTSSSKPVEQFQNDQQKKNYRIAYFKEAMLHPGLDPEMSQQYVTFLEKLKLEGHHVEAVDFNLLEYVVPAYYVLTTAEASSNLSRYDGIKFGLRAGSHDDNLEELYKATRSEGFGMEVKRRIMLGSFVLSAGYYDAYFTRAQKVRKLLANQIELIFNEFDIIVLPTSPATAFKAGEKMTDPIAMYLADIYTVTANLVGVPAISLPLFRHSNGLPFGLQAMGNRFNEVSLLRFSDIMLKAFKNDQALPARLN